MIYNGRETEKKDSKSGAAFQWPQGAKNITVCWVTNVIKEIERVKINIFRVMEYTWPRTGAIKVLPYFTIERKIIWISGKSDSRWLKKCLYTWSEPYVGGTTVMRNLIDYFIIQRGLENSVKRVDISPGADVGSDQNTLHITHVS